MAENGGCLDLEGSAAVPDEIPRAGEGAGSKGVRELFLELRVPMCRYLISLGLERTQAEDVAQESFLRLCAREQQPENVRGWMFRVAHNLAQDEHRRKKRKPADALDDGESAGNEIGRLHVVDGRPSPEASLLEREQDERLKAALQRLPLEQRHCLHLRAEGLKYREIGAVLDASTSTVAEWVQKGLKALERDLA